MGFAKLCDLEDFEDPVLLAAIADVIPERDPIAHLERKAWEVGMLARYLGERSLLNDEVRALGVGAGQERILFWMANRIGSVVATDIYGEGDFANAEAPASMLTEPDRHAPYPYRQDRLEVRWMDARDLAFPQASFDLVFSVSSLEHVGGPRDLRRAACEIGRVLKPGGTAALITECWVDRHPLDALAWSLPGRRGVDVLTPRAIRRDLIEASGLELEEPLDLRLSQGTFHNETRLRPNRSPEPRSGAFYPHLMMRYRRSRFTSVFLPLRKPPAG